MRKRRRLGNEKNTRAISNLMECHYTGKFFERDFSTAAVRKLISALLFYKRNASPKNKIISDCARLMNYHGWVYALTYFKRRRIREELDEYFNVTAILRFQERCVCFPWPMQRLKWCESIWRSVLVCQ